MPSKLQNLLLLSLTALWFTACSGANSPTAGVTGSAAEFSGDSVVATPPSTAVSAGNFTAWSVPTKPAALEDYTIFVQVKLPAHTEDYSLDDLSGHIQGTDGYEKLIGLDAIQQTFTFNSHGSALLKSFVPGGRGGVQDTVWVKSALLDDQEQLHLVFGSAPTPAAKASPAPKSLSPAK